MTVIKQSGPTTRRGPSYGKSVYLTERDGQIIVKKWPKKRSKKMSAKQLAAMEKFRQANLLVKYIPAEQVSPIMDVIQGTHLLPRDLFIKGMYGRLFSISLDDGRTLIPVAFMQEVSESLDAINNQPGSILARSDTLWVAVPSGLKGQILTSQGPALLPVWKPPAIGDISAVLTTSKTDNFTTNALAMIGAAFIPPKLIQVTAMYVAFNAIITATYRPIIFEASTTKILAILFRGQEFVATATQIETLWFDLPTAIPFLPGTRYGICLYRTDGTGTSPCQVRDGGSNARGWIGDSSDQFMQGALNNPQVNDTIVTANFSRFRATHIEYTT